MTNLNCYLCNKKSSLVYQIKNRLIYQCLNDDLFFSVDKKNALFIYGQDYYGSSPYTELPIFRDIYFQNKIKKILVLSPKEKLKILDVGCGWGNFLQILNKNHLPYLGIDISQEAIAICQKNTLNCQKADLINLGRNSRQKYSAITFFQVIEHLKNPLDYLRAAKKLLKKNGILLITTPNNNSPLRRLLGSKWPVYNTPSHYFFYSKRSLGRLLKMAGFNKFEIRIDPPRYFSLNYVLQRILKKRLSVFKIFDLPIPTDPWGDLEAIAVNI
ncbi:MAG: class I SAM-dependent methyltransferase [Patescibacteria group bacterium]|jgi:SAM-dependent methyltransferase